MVRFVRIVRFRLRETDYSLKTDYSLVRFETDLFLQQAPRLCTECWSQGRAKLRDFLRHLARENTQLSPSLTPTLYRELESLKG